ncbi:MAG TPA: AMP-binding protein [Syntrophorhabdaceae bacterium]|nr:AMP-binding protein [Syntrophorhabdaceae bacterium]HQM81759.1 AMP-binding protein [Syntrophorhabdaceae bacterium]
MPVKGFQPYKPEDVERYVKYRWWLGLTWGDMFDKATDLYPRKEALVDDTARFTYRELREKVDRLAIGLMGLGIKERDFVLLQIPNWHEFIFAFFALQKIGAIVVLLVARHSLSEVSYLSDLTNPVAWIGPDHYKKTDYLPMLQQVMEGPKGLRHIISVRSPENRAFTPLERLIEENELTGPNIEALAARRPDPMEVSIILPTGGTTGAPKAVPRTHNDYIANVEYHTRSWEVTCNDVMLTAAPVSHAQAIHNCVGGAFFHCARYVITDSTDAADICRVIEREKVTAFPTVPALIQRIVSLENLKDYDLSSLTRIYAGGAPSTPELVRSVYEKIGCKFVNALGSSEGPAAMSRLDADIETICYTVGEKDCPYTEVRIVDQYLRELPPNKEGELITKGPTIFSGYFRSEEENRNVFTEDGFFRTGDLAKIDEKGIMTITGRIKETILRGGETLSAIGIERLISSHPAVAEVAVIGMPDRELGERICAYVKLKEGASLSFEELVSYLKGIGASVLQLPERMEIIDAMPLTKVGKTDKKILKEDIAKKLGAA